MLPSANYGSAYYRGGLQAEVACFEPEIELHSLLTAPFTLVLAALLAVSLPYLVGRGLRWQLKTEHRLPPRSVEQIQQQQSNIKTTESSSLKIRASVDFG